MLRLKLVPARIEDYALIGDCQTAALVSRFGSIDWLCLPRFDSGACFAALLGGPEHGHWRLAPCDDVKRTWRSYREGTLVLDNHFEVDAGNAATVTDCMPVREEVPHLVRIVRGDRGRVRMAMELVLRFDYGSVVPWVRKRDGGITAIAGPDALRIQSTVPLRGERMTTVAQFDINEGETVAFALSWHPSYAKPPQDVDPYAIVERAEREWRAWSARCTYRGEWQDLVRRSLVVLKALTHTRTGGMVAAPTTSLPESIGGVRNWDYRFCWVRDATFTLLALIQNGYLDEARAWREWLQRAVAGDPSKLQILYGVDGTRRIDERTIPWLPGYGGSLPVRVGNGAFSQRQLDVYGEVMDAMYQSQRHGLESDESAWRLRCKLLEFLETGWDQPDHGIWEMRGAQRHFTHSKVMAWVAFDRGIHRLEGAGGGEPLERWRALRDRIHQEVCRYGFDTRRNAFVQYYGGDALDASVLMIPLVGFLPPDDPRVQGTARAIERELLVDGLVQRYRSAAGADGLPEGEGVFLPCSFWLADNYAQMGRHSDARALFERLTSLCNDVGLISEEYDPRARRLLGNFPQAFTHVSLVNCAANLSMGASGPAATRLSR